MNPIDESKQRKCYLTVSLPYDLVKGCILKICATPYITARVFIWCLTTVTEVTDGTISKSKRSKKTILPAGAVRFRFAADVDYEENETFGAFNSRRLVQRDSLGLAMVSS